MKGAMVQRNLEKKKRSRAGGVFISVISVASGVARGEHACNVWLFLEERGGEERRDEREAHEFSGYCFY